MKALPLKKQLFRIISVDDEGYLPSKIFDIAIIILICINVLLVILDTFTGFPNWVMSTFRLVETVSVIIFTIEYILRVWTATYLHETLTSAGARKKYMLSFMAIVDLIAILPFYIPFIIPIDLRVLRMIRLLRLLRILKVNRYTSALATVGSVIKRKGTQLLSSMLVVAVLMIMASVLMYNIECDAQPEAFENAFSGLWWAIATLTTVGYGDVYPITALGKILGNR
jgi:voltage-gated potassium channel